MTPTLIAFLVWAAGAAVAAANGTPVPPPDPATQEALRSTSTGTERPLRTAPLGEEDTEVPACFVPGEEGLDLHPGNAGALFWLGRRLTLTPPLTRLFGAAYFARHGVLLAVLPDGNVAVYRATDEYRRKLEHEQTAPPPFPLRVRNVHFTRIPGLMYLWGEAKETAQDASGAAQRQRQAWRLDLFELAADVEGVAVVPRVRGLLEGIAQVGGEPDKPVLRVSLRDQAPWLTLALPEPLGVAYVESAASTMARSLFVFPGEAIIVRTRDGFAAYGPDGRFRNLFRTGDMGVRQFRWPRYQNGEIRIEGETDNGAAAFRFDVRRGTVSRFR